MTHVKKTAALKKASSYFLVLFAMVLLFSASKTTPGLPAEHKPEATNLNKSTGAQLQDGAETVPYETLLPMSLLLPASSTAK